MRPAKLFLAVFLLINLALPAAFAQPVEQTLARLFSYDPHPATAMFADKVPVNGTLADIEIRFIESWVEKKDSANINRISFEITARDKGQTLASARTEGYPITTSMQKGDIIGATSLANLNFKATLDSFEKNRDGVTDLTAIFSISYSLEALKTAKDAEANKATSSSLTLSRKLAEKADSLPDKHAKTKISLYEKALIAAPAAASSPAAREFRSIVEQKIAALKGNTKYVAPDLPSKPAAIDDIPAVTPSIPETKPTSTTYKPKVNPEAVNLYQQAKTLFAQDKGPEGREALRKALEIAPDYYDALVLLGDNAFGNRKFSRAKEAFEKALNLNDKDSDSMLKYFKACYYMGEGSDAINKLLVYKNRYPESNGIKLALSEAYFQLGDLPNARQVCLEVLQADPANYQAKELLKRIDRLMK
jgi:tetratricopeptide (TPR) repeat protein